MPVSGPRGVTGRRGGRADVWLAAVAQLRVSTAVSVNSLCSALRVPAATHAHADTHADHDTHQVVPAKWDWGKFLKAAVKLLPYAFEKSDAQEKWGGENVFAVAMGGR